LYRQMQGQNEYVLSKQLLRAGTSIGANVEEASAAQSRKDFAAKMAISSKEARETHYWLRLIRDSQLCMNIDVGPLIEDFSLLRKYSMTTSVSIRISSIYLLFPFHAQ